MSSIITRTESIRHFLNRNSPADLAMLYTPEMECQVNVAQDGGEKTSDTYKGRTWHGYTDGVQTWKAFRIPRNANTIPEYEDRKMTFDLAAHAEGIGMTGWNWAKLRSQWVAYDFDAIAGHKENHQKKLTKEELEGIIDKTSEISWVTLRKSTGGQGLHLYVFLDPPIPTKNHNEHAALARAILGKISGLTGFAFDTKVDICGQNMWVWHRKLKSSEGGLQLIKRGTYLTEAPPNWREHVNVITRAHKRTLPKFSSDISSENSTAESLLLELTGQSSHVPLNREHTELIKYLEENKTGSWWDSDHHILVTHTWHLQAAKEALNLRGIFKTQAKGTEAPEDINCFCIPMHGGAWAVRRYSMGVSEDATWEQDGRGWTRCFLNREPNLSAVSRAHGGLESPSGGFIFKVASDAIDAATDLGISIPNLPGNVNNLKATLKEHHKDGRIVMEIEGDSDGIAEMKGWLFEKKKWRRMFNVVSRPSLDSETQIYDEFIRHLITNGQEDCGWAIKGETGWRDEPLIHVRTVLQSMSLGQKEIQNILGSSILKAWTIVNRPFQPEFPGNREWNRGAAQFRFLPSQDTDNLQYPTWLMVLNHCGASLDSALKNNAWASANGVETGGDYLKIWLASMFSKPMEPLPYLFFYGPQNAGKSLFHEAIALLLTKGYVRADNALINQQGFSGELRHAICCVIEEINLRKAKEALNRIKDWVTAREISIHAKGETPYHVPNSTHWIQCSNEADACPILPGDSRITMIRVEQVDLEHRIAKTKILLQLEKEAPDFLAALLQVEIPPSNDRLNVPVILTSEKMEAERMNRNPLESFIEEQLYRIPGAMVTVAEFYERFSLWAEPNDLTYWTKRRVGQEFPIEFPKGRNPKTGHHCIGNLSFEAQTGPSGPKLVCKIGGPNLTYLVPNGEAVEIK